MASKRVSTREELQRLRRADVQKIAKDYHIKANLKTDALIDEIMRVQQENQPSPKAADSSLGSGSHGSRVAKPNPSQAKPSARTRRSKLPGVDGPRKTADVYGIIMPPGVVAAKSDIKGKGRAIKPVYAAPKKGVTRSKLPIAKTVSLEDVKVDQETNLTTEPSGSSYELPSPDRPVPRSDSSLIASLNSRVAKLEDAREASRERRKKENEMMGVMHNKLQAAHDSIDALARRHDALKARIDSLPAAAAPGDVSNILERLIKLEEIFSKMGVKKAPSASSSDADGGLPWEPSMQRSAFQTPPNRPDPIQPGSRILAPPAILGTPGRHVGAPRTPPPQIRRYHVDPDESPSPTRLPSNSGRILSRPPAVTVPTAGSKVTFAGRSTRRSSAIEEAESLLYSDGVADSPRRGRHIRKSRSGGLSDGIEDSDGPDEGQRNPSKRQKRADSAEREYDAHERDAPVAKLPFPIVPALSAPSSPLYTAPATASHSRRTPRELTNRGNVRSQPYAKDAASRRHYSGGPNADAEAEEDSPRNIPDLFGATPDRSRVPPLAFADGTIPVLHLGRPSLSNSIVPETPMSSPLRPPAPADATPPASRTRYGTEFGTTMKAKFSD